MRCWPGPPGAREKKRTARVRRVRRRALESLEPRRVLASGYLQLNLVADQASTALVQDANLANPTGAALNATGGDLFIADQTSGLASLYLGAVNGSAFQLDSPVVIIPGGSPAGAVTNGTPNFVVQSGNSSGPASVLFGSDSGLISGWNQGVPPPAPSNQAQMAVTTNNAIYTGLALAFTGSQNLLYAADFHDQRIDVFDGAFNSFTTAGAFTDPNLPAGFAPYNIANLGGRLLVSYAQQDAGMQNPVAGPGAGIVDAYNYNGTFQTRLISNGNFGQLNEPWGMALAPMTFGDFSGDLLVANQGDGTIKAFDLNTGALQGVLTGAMGQPLVIDGVHALQFGNGLTTGSGNALFVTSGPNGGQHGLLSELVSAQGVSLAAQGTVVSAKAGTAFSGTLAIFTDAASLSPGSFTVSIDWGDGTTTTGTVSPLARGGFAVSGSHTYNSGGLESISIHVSDPFSHSATANSVARVVQPGVVANGVTFVPTEGIAFSGTVASFTDGDGNTSTAPYSAAIDWGDGITTAGTIAAAGAGFIVQGQHTYAEEANRGVTVSISDTDGHAATAASTAQVADAPLMGAGRTLSLVEQTAFSGTVASFTDANPAATKSDFTAAINWGDGTTTTGTITAGSGDFSVSGSHTYADEEAQNISVTVKDTGASTATIQSAVHLADADTLVATVVPAVITEGVAFSGTLATFIDTLASTPAGDFEATVDWGDGTTTSGSVSGAGGHFTLQGSHTYADEGAFTLTASVNDVGGTAAAVAQQVVAVAEHDALTIAAAPFAPTEGIAFSGAVATVTDTDHTTPAGDFSATIDWGDGTTTSGSVSGAAGQFTISGNHAYAEEGPVSPVVSIVEDAPGAASATTTLTAAVADAPLNGTPVTLNLSEGVAFSAVVAIVSDSNPDGSAGELSATIDWGDGTTTTGTIVSGGGGLQVSGSHTYAEGGAYQPVVTVRDVGGASVVVPDSAVVADYPLTATGTTINLREQSSSAVAVATFSDADPDGGSSGEYTATIDWGDGATTPGVIVGSSGNYQVRGSHAYADEGRHTLTIVVQDTGGSRATTSSLAIVTEATLSDGTGGTPNTRWVNEIYGDLLHRSAEPAALTYWGGRLAAGEGRAFVVFSIESTAEYRGDEVNQIYEHYLHRAADPGAISFGTSYLATGNTVEQLTSLVVGSHEYYTNRGGGTNDGFLTVLYQDALGRPVDSGARHYFDSLLAGGAARSQVAAAVFASDEYLGDLGAQIYLDLLERPVDTGAKTFWISEVHHGLHDEQIVAAVCASDEYFAKTSP